MLSTLSTDEASSFSRHYQILLISASLQLHELHVQTNVAADAVLLKGLHKIPQQHQKHAGLPPVASAEQSTDCHPVPCFPVGYVAPKFELQIPYKGIRALSSIK
jgi:hypothetical protein